jgi:hypothetical protein
MVVALVGIGGGLLTKGIVRGALMTLGSVGFLVAFVVMLAMMG